MTERHLPVHPNLDQLKHQAKDLLREMRESNTSAKLSGAQYALELGAEICDDSGNRLAPVAMLLETYTRNAKGKHKS